MISKIAALIGFSLVLASCDTAMEQLDAPIRTAVAEQCQQMSESLSIAGDIANSVCECSADKFMEGDSSERTNVSREKVEGIVKACIAESGTQTEAAPAEEPNV